MTDDTHEYKVEPGTSLDEAIGVAIGAASVCWENPGGAGAFLSTRAGRIAEELATAIRDGRVRDGAGRVRVSRWQPLDERGQVVMPADPPIGDSAT